MANVTQNYVWTKNSAWSTTRSVNFGRSFGRKSGRRNDRVVDTPSTRPINQVVGRLSSTNVDLDHQPPALGKPTVRCTLYGTVLKYVFCNGTQHLLESTPTPVSEIWSIHMYQDSVSVHTIVLRNPPIPSASDQLTSVLPQKRQQQHGLCTKPTSSRGMATVPSGSSPYFKSVCKSAQCRWKHDNA